MENCGKTAVFPGGYGRIGEIPHGRIWPDWGLKGYSCLNILVCAVNVLAFLKTIQ